MALHVVHVCSRFFPHIGGMETHVLEICRRLVAKGLDVEVFCADLDKHLRPTSEIHGISVKRFRSLARSEAVFLPNPQLFSSLRRCDADIVHTHQLQGSVWMVASAAKHRTGKLVITPHYHGRASTPLRGAILDMLKLPTRLFLKRASHLICVSEWEKRVLIKDFPKVSSKISVIPNGLDLETLSRVKKRDCTERPKILYVGRLEAYKNVDKLIEAVKLLSNHFGIKAELTIVGMGPCEGIIRKIIRESGLEKDITIRQEITRCELLDEYSSSTVFVMLSENEAFNLACAEALSIGLPTLVANGSALSEYVQTGLAQGVPIPVEGWQVAVALSRILKQPSDFSTKKLALRHLIDWDRVVSLTLDVYDSLVA
jgi:glycosyltransferase involved in cell wall biosynthesis